ncbi:PP2C family protein-serine/threonine phosphatase [Streptacidiphilus fuscans]|uniref:PP2C family protein-serine/threonine phosphatase n=1 Tax=Streptacidiphilus fuscans TaxID=2789292 RepID=A0A931FEM2_9ACTN|nr:PP2C family protein-serine/threonine phosphatase [Streptacidiphilus fuscans]MBF9070758.1 PP2C family protein-serine/threonine phosphatase [Streptacidiphilus fuscans]
MSENEILILHGPSEVPRELLAALRKLGAAVDILTPEEVLLAEPDRYAEHNVLLVAAELPATTVRIVARRLEANGRGPTVVAFADHDLHMLDQHVNAGWEYLVPPFNPELVRTRLRDCRHRASFSRTVEDVAAHAELLSYERELEIGREIQRGFLPGSLPKPNGWEIDVRFRPAKTVAGDFYDAFEIVNRRRLALVVADVCDKGVGAALFMALIRSLLRHTAEQSGLQNLIAADLLGEEAAWQEQSRAIPVVGATPLLNAVVGTNNYLIRNHIRQGYFATMFFGVLDPATGNLVYINGGHNPPVLVSGNGSEPVMLEPTGPAVGVIPDSNFSLGYAQISPGDTLFVYTDGVTEARSPTGEFFGEERMLDLLKGGTDTGKDLLQHMDEALCAFVGSAEQFDDITMMAAHWPVAEA